MAARRLRSVGSPATAPDPELRAWVETAYARYFDYVWGLLGRLGVPPASLDDAAQDVFLVLYRKRAEFRRESHVRTLLHGIAINIGRRHRAKLARDRLDPLTGLLQAETASPEDRAQQRSDLARLDEHLRHLPAEQHEVFVLTEVAGMTAPEIANLLRLKLNTVYSRLRLSRKTIARRIAADRPEGGHDDHA